MADHLVEINKSNKTPLDSSLKCIAVVKKAQKHEHYKGENKAIADGRQVETCLESASSNWFIRDHSLNLVKVESVNIRQTDGRQRLRFCPVYLIMRPLALAVIVTTTALTLLVLAQHTEEVERLVEELFNGKKNTGDEGGKGEAKLKVNNDKNEIMPPAHEFQLYLEKPEIYDRIAMLAEEKFQRVSQGQLNYRKSYNFPQTQTTNEPAKRAPTATAAVRKIQGSLVTAVRSAGASDEARNKGAPIGKSGSDSMKLQDENKKVLISPPLSADKSKAFNGAILSSYIRGIGLSSSLSSDNMNEQQQKEQHQNIQDQIRGVKCSNNKFDRLIAQKIRLNDLSRPIITEDGRFDNPFPTWKGLPSYYDTVRFLTVEKDLSNIPKTKEELDKELPIMKPDFRSDWQLPDQDYRVTWLGHSTLLIQTEDFNILTDPIFSDRASPIQLVGPKRYRDAACQIRDLPRIDVVLISHNHYDHLDTNSVKEINDRFGNKCRWIVPLGIGEYLQTMNIENYVELDWWQKDCFHVDQLPASKTNNTASQSGAKNSSPKPARSTRKELDIYLTPSQHWSRRGVNDYNKSLWGSYTIVNSNGSTFFFNGDTGYCDVFKEIGKIFGPFSGAAIPIGAYSPRWFLKSQHVDPEEAIQIHLDLKSMKSIPIHHSTFPLSYEPFKEPVVLLEKLTEQMKTNGTILPPFKPLKHGETSLFCRKCESPPK